MEIALFECEPRDLLRFRDRMSAAVGIDRPRPAALATPPPPACRDVVVVVDMSEGIELVLALRRESRLDTRTGGDGDFADRICGDGASLRAFCKRFCAEGAANAAGAGDETPSRSARDSTLGGTGRFVRYGDDAPRSLALTVELEDVDVVDSRTESRPVS